jgi:hypothetical protein
MDYQNVAETRGKQFGRIDVNNGDQRYDTTACRKLCGNIQVPTEDEVAALNAMRNIKDRVREIKKKISEISSSKKLEDVKRVSGWEKEMAQLKEEWDVWERKRKEAARVRMVLLGHEEEGGL